ALAADIHVAGPLDERTDVPVALAAEGTVGVAVTPRVPRRPSPAPSWARVFGRHAISLSLVGPVWHGRQGYKGPVCKITTGPTLPRTVWHVGRRSRQGTLR